MRDLQQAGSVSPLRAILARVAADGVQSESELNPGTRQQAIRVILDRIDTCMLARKLTFVLGGTDGITLEAAGRRLLRICSVDESAGATQPDLLGTPLSGNDDGHLSGVASLLAALCDACRPISVRSEPLDAVSGPAATGISVAKLREALDLPSAEAPLRDPDMGMAELFDIAPAAVFAEYTVRHGWQPTETEGRDCGPQIAAMQSHLEDRARLDTLLEEGSLLVLDLAPDVSGCIAVMHGEPAAVIVTQDAAMALSRVFAKAYG